MKFNFLKFKKQGPPSLKSLRPQIFDVNLLWFTALGVCVLIVAITTLIGFSFFYSQYFENYNGSESVGNIENIMNINKLKGAIEKRNNILNQNISISRDPSL
jgi:hypothetical protein